MVSQEAKVDGRSLRTGAARWVVGLLTLVMIGGLVGCEEGDRAATTEEPVAAPQLSDIYTGTVLGKSSSLDVLGMVKKRSGELPSQSDSVVASQGQDNDGLKLWFTMVGFDEHSMTAARKYFFLVDEEVQKGLFSKSKQGMVFDCQTILPASITEKSYEDENARILAMLGYIEKAFTSDVDALGEDIATGAPDVKRLGVSGLMVKRVIRDIRTRIGASPVLAGRLGTSEGLDFDHPNFENGNARIATRDNLVRLSIELGAPAMKYGDWTMW